MSFLAALAHRHTGTTPPIWLMRQAGRYLPDYHRFKESQSLLEMFHDPKTIVAVTQLPLHTLPLDAAILFSDILTVLDGLGVSYTFQDQVGPLIDFQGFSAHQNAYTHIVEAIGLLKEELTVPLIGFAGAPFTIASYLIEGKTSKNFLKAKKEIAMAPQQMLDLLDRIVEETCAYLDVQIAAGVDAIQLFDSWAHHLAYTEFLTFSLAPLAKVVAHVKRHGVPIILFSKAASLFPQELASLNPTAMSIDWSCHLPHLRKQIPRHIALQGNLDPTVLYGSIEHIKQAVDPLLEAMKGDPGYIFNLGHGILPDTPYENVRWLVDYVKH